MLLRTVHEWQSIAHGHGETEVPEWAAGRLAAVARSLSPSAGGGEGGERILIEGRRQLHVRQMVGVLAADDCALEILPKIDGLDEGGTREQLVHMLAVAIDMDILDGKEAALSVQKESLLDILIRLFARRMTEALRRGMPRAYVGHEDDLPALRGRLDVHRQFTILAAAPQRLACRYDELSPDIPLNRIMKAAVMRLLDLARVPGTQRLLRELGFAYADITTVPVSALPWDRVTLDRTNRSWRSLLSLARLLLEKSFQTTTSGSKRGVALLFDMAALFEAYVAKQLHRALTPCGFQVVTQGGRLFCLTEPGTGRGVFQTRPDILVKRAGRTELVIDTKWKRISPRVDDAKQGISQSDIYQMMAYGRLYGCERLMLLYPHHAALGPSEGLQSRHLIARAMQGADHADDQLFTASIDVATLFDMKGRLADIVVATTVAPD